MNILALMGIAAVGSIILLAISYGFWLFTRPKKVVYAAKIWVVSESKRKVTDRDGNEIITLKDLRPHSQDFLERVIYGYREVYRLQRLGRTTPAVTTDVVENWGKNQLVNVLYHNDSCTLLKKGYDEKSGEQIFSPIPYDMQNLIKNESTARKNRVKSEKDILMALAPYVAVVFSIMLVLGLGYMSIQGILKINEMNNQNMLQRSQIMLEITETQRDGMMEFSKRSLEAAELYASASKELSATINNELAFLNGEIDRLTKQINSSKLK